MDEDTTKRDIYFISSWPPETCGSSAEHQGNNCLQQNISSPQGAQCEVVGNKKTSHGHKWNDKEPIVQGKRSYADVAIARWWRHEGKALAAVEGLDVPNTSNPQSVINFIIKTELGQNFMKQEVEKLFKNKKRVVSDGDQAKRLAVLSTFLEKLKRFKEAKECIENAVNKTTAEGIANDVKEYKWIRERIERQIHVREIQETIGQTSVRSSREWPQYQQVERRSALSLTSKEFFHHYAMLSKPLVITDIVSTMATVPWTLEHIRDVAGRCPVTLKRLDPHSTDWARLENSKQTTVGEFIDSLEEQQDLAVTDKTYLFDWSLPIHCPRLSEELVLPKYFTNNFLQKTSPDSLYRDSWPSLFVAPSGVRSELHVDAFGSNFWMALFEGKKRWVFFDKEDVPCLYPTYCQSMDPVFAVDLSDPDFSRYPLLKHTSPMECVLQPGELLFVPAGCPHRVENLEKSLAISANFVDQSNYDLVIRELAVNGLMDERAEQLVDQFKSEEFNKSMDFSSVT